MKFDTCDTYMIQNVIHTYKIVKLRNFTFFNEQEVVIWGFRAYTVKEDTH